MTNGHRQPRSPLDGLRVLDLSRAVSGPFAGRILADLGADVVKAELPGADLSQAYGKMTRGRGEVWPAPGGPILISSDRRYLWLQLKDCFGASSLTDRLAQPPPADRPR